MHNQHYTIENPTELQDLPPNPQRKCEGGLRTKGYYKVSLPDKYLISIITVVFNRKKYIEKTIQSVINQSYSNVEYIIIDGGSTDGTIDIIKKYDQTIDYWVSEPDKGIYDAMNKGIDISSGNIIGIINADDYYFENVFEIVISSFKDKDLNKYIFWGDIISGNGKVIKGFSKKKLKIGTFALHPSMFCPKKIYKKIGNYNTFYKIAGDYDFMYRAINKNGIIPLYVPEKIAYFRKEGISSQNLFRALTEEMLIKVENGESIKKSLLIYILKIIKNFTRL